MEDNWLCWVIMCQSKGMWNVAPFKALFLSHFPCCKYKVSWWDHYWAQDSALSLCWWCKTYFSGLVAAGPAPWEIPKDAVKWTHQELLNPRPEKICVLGKGHTPEEGTQSPQRMLTETCLLFLFSCTIPRPHHRTLVGEVNVIAAVHYLNVMDYCDTLCPPSNFILHQLFLIISKSSTRLYFGYV